MATEEILHMRDGDLSTRHRDFWGLDCPMTDVDFLAVEFDRCIPTALVDYKQAQMTKHFVEETAAIRTLRCLADRAGLPFWVAFYRKRAWSFQIVPLNVLARNLFGHDPFISLTEFEYVEVLYKLRGRPLPDDLAASLNNSLNGIRDRDMVGLFAHRRTGRKKIRPNVANLCHPKRIAQAKR